MSKQDTLIILTPAFAANVKENWLPSQADFVRNLNALYPSLSIIILAFHFPIVKEKRAVWFGNSVIYFNGGMKGNVNTLLRWTKVWQELKKIRSQHNVLGIFSFFCSESAFIGHYFAQRYGIKHHIWLLGQDARPDNKQVKRIRPEADELVAISDFLVDEFSNNHGVKPAHIVPLGINPANFSTEVSKRDIDIIGVGSLSPIKQYDLFVEIISEIAKSVPEIRARICGGGMEYKNLQQLIQQHGLNDNLRLEGELAHLEVLKLMQRSRILLHPSSYEGFGMVCTEALYAGAHVVSFCQPMHNQIGHWHIVKTKEEMIAKCLELLQSDSLNHSPVLPYEMKHTAMQIMSLYGYNEAAINQPGA